MQDKKLKYLLIINSLFVVLLVITGSFLNSPLFWGFNYLAFTGIPVKIIFIISGLMIFIPQVRDFFLKTLEESKDLIKKKFAIPLLFIFFILFYFVFRVRIHFLGDGPMILRMLPQMDNVTDMIATNEPGSYTVAVFIQKIIRNIYGDSYTPELVFIFLSIAAGIIFIYVLYSYVDSIASSPSLKIIYFIILFFCSNVIFFLGYVETYQLVFLLMFVYMVLSVSYLNRKGNTVIYASIVFGVWLSCHYLAALFIPSFIVLLVFAFRRDFYSAVISLMLFFASFFLIFMLTGLSLDEMSGRFFEPGFSHWLSPFAEMPDGTVPAFSFYHLLDAVNSQLLALSAGLFTLIAFIAICFKRLSLRDPVTVFLGIMCLASVFFLLFFNSHIGLSRDWDVSALMSYPFLFFFIYLFNLYSDSKKNKKELLLVSYVSVWVTVIWLALNANIPAAELRNSNLADNRLWNNTRISLYYEELGTYSRNRLNYDKAIEYYRKGLEVNPDAERLAFNLSYVYRITKKFDEAEQVLNGFINKSADKHSIYFRLGLVQMDLQKFDDAIANFTNALKYSPYDADALGNIAGCYYHKKDFAKSIDYSKKIIDLYPEISKPYIGLGDCFLAMGDTSNAKLYYNIAKEKDRDMKLKNEIESRMKLINGLK